MGYSIKEMSVVSGITPRALRHYETLGLLKPHRSKESGYRSYSSKEVDQLQEVLFLKELGVPLKEIADIVANPDFDRESALKSHLSDLIHQRSKLDDLIGNLQKTIKVLKGEDEMSDQEKFIGLKQQIIDDNEAAYGKEAREKYGDEAVDRSNAKIKSLSEAEMKRIEELTAELNDTIQQALKSGDPTGPLAQKACELHKDWLNFYWPEGHYTKEAHKGLADMYCLDSRFKAYYDKLGSGCAEFIRDAIHAYCDGDGRKSPEVDEYILQFSPEVREILAQFREMILAEAPMAVERMAYGIPTYTMKKNLIHFGGYKNHIGLYPTAEGIEAFAKELSPYKVTKGTVQFPLAKPMPWALIRQIIKNRVENAK